MRFRGTVYGAHHPRWAYRPDSGEGAALFGGRFNPKGTPALYTARRLETAWLEAQQGFAFKAQPMTICAYGVDCDGIVDLTDDSERLRLGVTMADLGCDWEATARRGQEPVTWALSRQLMGDGSAGIVVRSFAPGARDQDVNVVFWRWSGFRLHKVVVVDHHSRLPTDDGSSQ